MNSYQEFLRSKQQLGGQYGFEPIWLPDVMFPFQRDLTAWAIRKGRAALLEDCGLGKGLQALVWAENVIRHTNKPVLILAPLAVSLQFAHEAKKFGIDARVSRDGTVHPNITVTNYQQLHRFDTNAFSGVVCDESGCLKNFDGKIKEAVTEFLRTRPYRLLCTATAAPNDYVELGTHAEALGEMGYQDMITKFFRKVLANRGTVGWGIMNTFQLRPHAARDFWRWVCSWARAIRKPSDLGYDDGPFLLPKLTINEHEVGCLEPTPGYLFPVTAVTLHEQRQETRRTLEERCEKVAELVDHDRPSICWCHLNDEGDLLERLIPGAVQVSGRDSDDEKEEKLMAFVNGQVKKLVTKSKIAGFGLNLQCCSHFTSFATNSFEAWYQLVRRCWRFGQQNPVTGDIVVGSGEDRVRANLQRKSDASDQLFDELVALMHDQLTIRQSDPYTSRGQVPSWLQA